MDLESKISGSDSLVSVAKYPTDAMGRAVRGEDDSVGRTGCSRKSSIIIDNTERVAISSDNTCYMGAKTTPLIAPNNIPLDTSYNYWKLAVVHTWTSAN